MERHWREREKKGTFTLPFCIKCIVFESKKENSPSFPISTYLMLETDFLVTLLSVKMSLDPLDFQGLEQEKSREGKVTWFDSFLNPLHGLTLGKETKLP